MFYTLKVFETSLYACVCERTDVCTWIIFLSVKTINSDDIIATLRQSVCQLYIQLPPPSTS